MIEDHGIVGHLRRNAFAYSLLESIPIANCKELVANSFYIEYRLIEKLRASASKKYTEYCTMKLLTSLLRLTRRILVQIIHHGTQHITENHVQGPSDSSALYGIISDTKCCVYKLFQRADCWISSHKVLIVV